MTHRFGHFGFLWGFRDTDRGGGIDHNAKLSGLIRLIGLVDESLNLGQRGEAIMGEFRVN